MNSNNERKEAVCLKQIGSSSVAKLVGGAWAQAGRASWDRGSIQLFCNVRG